MKLLAVCLVICLITIGTVSATTFAIITTTPTPKLVIIPTTTATPSTQGTLEVTRNLYGNLYIDDVLVPSPGSSVSTPYRIPKKQGAYTVIYRISSYYTTNSPAPNNYYLPVETVMKKPAVIYAGRTTTLDFVSQPTGCIRFESVSPWGGSLSIDNTLYTGNDMRVMPVRVMLPPGSHAVRYEKTDHTTYSTTAFVTALQDTPLSIAIQPVPAAANPVVPVNADFLAGPVSGNPPLSVQFTDMSTGSPDSWSWNFGDGTSSTSRNPAHSYGNSGQYSVTLSVAKQGAGTNTKTRVNYITVTNPGAAPAASPVTADFVPLFGSGTSPLVIHFSDTSTGGPDTWLWDFGDGTPPVGDQNPWHTYEHPGTFTVTLTATNTVLGASDTESKAGFIVTSPDTKGQNPAPLPAVTPAQTGSLSVTSIPGSAAVLIQDTVMGATPVTIPGLSPGTVPVRVILTGYPEYSTMATITAGQVTVLRVNLTSRQEQAVTTIPAPLPPVTTQVPAGTSGPNPVTVQGFGSLTVTTDPVGAKVWVDDVMGGVTPVTIPNLAAGTHKVRLAREGYEEIDTVVTILPDQSQQYTTSLSRKPEGILSGISVPGLTRTPGFEAAVAFAGLCLCGILRRVFPPTG